eukprot:6212200-Pleurochrysis_carterae.AAC.4
MLADLTDAGTSPCRPISRNTTRKHVRSACFQPVHRLFLVPCSLHAACSVCTCPDVLSAGLAPSPGEIDAT